MAAKIYKGGACPGLPTGLTVEADGASFALFLDCAMIAWGKMEYDCKGFGGMIWRTHGFRVSDTNAVMGIIQGLQDYTNAQRRIRIEEKLRRERQRMIDAQRELDEAFEGWERAQE